jgi:hypothetical protein
MNFTRAPLMGVPFIYGAENPGLSDQLRDVDIA